MDTEQTKPSRLTNRTRITMGAAALIAIGGAAGAVAVTATRPSIEMAPLAPTAIRSLTDGENIVTVKGRTAEIFGNKFIMADATGRALVDTGRAGEDKALVAAGQPVTVQGRFDNGVVHASFLIGPDGKVVSLRPMRPPHGPGGPHDERGPRGDAPPPPPVAPQPAVTTPAPEMPAAATK